MQINVSESINSIRNRIMRTLLKNWTPHGGWEQFFSESIESALRYHLIRQFYSQSEQQYKFNAVANLFHQNHWEYKINFEEKTSIEHLIGVLLRGTYITHLFNETYNGFGTGLFRHVLSLDWNTFQLNKELEGKILQSLLDSIVQIDYHNKVLKAIADEICNQFNELPSEAQDLFVLTHPKDGLTSKMAFESLAKKLFQEARYINLPDIARDKEWCIPDLIEDRRRGLQEQTIWNQLQWIEKKGKFIVDDILQDLQDEKRRQYAKKRSPHRADNKEYLDAEKLKSDGSKVLTLEILEGKHDSLQTQPMDIRSQLTASQKKALRDFLSDTKVKILETLYNYPDFTQEEVAEYIGYTQSKVSKAQRKFKQFEEKIKKILEIQ